MARGVVVGGVLIVVSVAIAILLNERVTSADAPSVDDVAGTIDTAAPSPAAHMPLPGGAGDEPESAMSAITAGDAPQVLR